jgi:hypothetical protein
VCHYQRIGRNRELKRLELCYGSGKGLHQYHYFQHPQLGFMHARLQAWFPFTKIGCRVATPAAAPGA